METLIAILIGILFAGGVYCLLQRSLVRLVIGIMLIGQAANLLTFAASGLTRKHTAIIKSGAQTLEAPYADPLPQALVLTAIVIGFGFTAFCLALLHRTYKTLGHDDLDKFNTTDTEK
ncbi:Na+/H+ antiporter subunit C [Lentisphaera profundi]|uniref:Na+/H+ antiporter subunit C n=1 Tax=Lentisphaera profundi TaxID=1658616 RepID=A0ABY7VMZ8_9BACT|nr:Na+/H+ antiporter subunit C [Lentisphaera profundi]WDE95450.1 Na+/H+ antiporter subunit C [Lentisphaera profundi]